MKYLFKAYYVPNTMLRSENLVNNLYLLPYEDYSQLEVGGRGI